MKDVTEGLTTKMKPSVKSCSLWMYILSIFRLPRALAEREELPGRKIARQSCLPCKLEYFVCLYMSFSQFIYLLSRFFTF